MQLQGFLFGVNATNSFDNVRSIWIIQDEAFEITKYKSQSGQGCFIYLLSQYNYCNMYINPHKSFYEFFKDS